MTTEEQFRQCLRLANESAKRLFDQEHDLIMAEKNDPDFWQKNTGLFGIIDKELNKTKSNMTKARIGTEWVSCCEHLPLDGVDNCNKFLVRIEERFSYSTDVVVNYAVAEWNDNRQDHYRSMRHDGTRVICYNFDVDWDIDEGQIIEVTHWREIPEVPNVEGKMINFSRITENNYDEWYANGDDKWK